MRITESKLRRIIRRVLREGEGDGLSDPQVEEAYYELQNMSPSDFAPDADLSFLDRWPYSEARDILADEEAAEYEEYEEDTDEARYSEREGAVRARQNRGMYEMKYRLIREFGESDAEVIRQSQNREKMIGIGMDGGKIGFDPNWDYANNSPLKPKKMHRLKPELQMVADMISGGGVGDNLELMPGRNNSPPDMFYFTMVGTGIKARVDYQSYNVQKNHPEFTGEGCFVEVVGPDAVKFAWQEGAQTTDPADIEGVLENFKEWASNNIQEDSPWMTFAPAS